MTPPATTVVSDWAVLAKAPVMEDWLASSAVFVDVSALPELLDGDLVVDTDS